MELASLVVESLAFRSPGGLSSRLSFWSFVSSSCGKLKIDPFLMTPIDVRKLWEIKGKTTRMAAFTFVGSFNRLRTNFGLNVVIDPILKRAIQTSQIHFAPRKGHVDTPAFCDLMHLEFLTLPSTKVNKNIKLVAAAFCMSALCVSRVIDLHRFELEKVDWEMSYFQGNLFTIKNPQHGGLHPKVEVIGPLSGLLTNRWFEPIAKNHVKGRIFILRALSGKLLSNTSVQLSVRADPNIVRGWVVDLFSIPSPFNWFSSSTHPNLLFQKDMRGNLC